MMNNEFRAMGEADLKKRIGEEAYNKQYGERRGWRASDGPRSVFTEKYREELRQKEEDSKKVKVDAFVDGRKVVAVLEDADKLNN